MTQHKQLWEEICACESDIHFHCNEGITGNFYFALESADYETSPTYIGIHKMLKRCVTQLITDWCEKPTIGVVAEAVQKAVFGIFSEAKPLLPSQVIKHASALLIVLFYQLKIQWWRYWYHLQALIAKVNLLRYEFTNIYIYISVCLKYGSELSSKSSTFAFSTPEMINSTSQSIMKRFSSALS